MVQDLLAGQEILLMHGRALAAAGKHDIHVAKCITLANHC